MRSFLAIIILTCIIILAFGVRQYESAHNNYFICTSVNSYSSTAVRDCDLSTDWSSKVNFWQTINNIAMVIGFISLIALVTSSFNKKSVSPTSIAHRRKLLKEDTIDDDTYNDAVSIVINSGKASASLLQRRLRIGYARAARIIELMEEKGIIGPADGARPRDVLVKK